MKLFMLFVLFVYYGTVILIVASVFILQPFKKNYKISRIEAVSSNYLRLPDELWFLTNSGLQFTAKSTSKHRMVFHDFIVYDTIKHFDGGEDRRVTENNTTALLKS